LTSLLLLALAAVAGCGDMVTYSDESRAQGIKYLADRDYPNATGAFRNAVRQEPRDFQSHFYLGQCYDQSNQHLLAVESYNMALGVMPRAPYARPEDAPFRARIREALAQTIGKHDGRDVALNGLEARVKANPSAEGHLILAKTYRYRNDFDLALTNYHQAALYGSDDFEILKEYGLYLVEVVNQPRVADTTLRQAYRLNPNDEQVNNALRRIAVVPGPSLKAEKDLAQPLIPKGPLPELNLSGAPAGRPHGAAAVGPQD